MTSRQHQDWINHNSPDSGLARPLAELRDLLRQAGYTVYDLPDTAHLDAQPPEDHTCYSETGWPNASPKWWRHAIDIMPPPAGKGLPSLTDLGGRMYAARQAGHITWLKYMNWPSSGDLGRAVQDRWEPGHVRGTSSDTGHIHLSCVTGVETLDAPYNPLAVGTVLTGVLTQDQEVDDMFLAYQGNTFYLCDGFRSRPITSAAIVDLKTLIKEGLVPPVLRIDNPRPGWYEGAFGAVTQPATVDVAALATALKPLLPAGATVDVAALATALKPLLPSHIELTGTVA